MREHIRRRPHLWAFALALLAIVVAAAGCVGTGVDTFEEFEGSIEGGASCDELFDQRANFEDPKVLDRIDEAMDEVGCERRDSQRNDT